jgi:hypothetical protein
MRVIISEVVVNQVTAKEYVDKSTGEVKVMRDVDIFIPRDPNDEFSKSKAITARVVDSPEAIAAFKHLQTKEGQKVSLLGDYTPAREWTDKKTGKTQHFDESFKIFSVIDSASIKVVEMLKMKAA